MGVSGARAYGAGTSASGPIGAGPLPLPSSTRLGEGCPRPLCSKPQSSFRHRSEKRLRTGSFRPYARLAPSSGRGEGGEGCPEVLLGDVRRSATTRAVRIDSPVAIVRGVPVAAQRAAPRGRQRARERSLPQRPFTRKAQHAAPL